MKRKTFLLTSWLFFAAGSAFAAHQVQPVILVPLDWTIEFQDWGLESYFRNNIVTATERFYARNNINETFRSTAVQVVLAYDRSTDWFWCKTAFDGCALNNFEHNVVQYLNGRGVNVDSNADRVHWILAMGGGGYAGGRYFTNTGGGRAIIGDAAVTTAKYNNCDRVRPVFPGDDIVAKCLGWTNHSGRGIGTFIHELGHGFDLPHPPSSQFGTTIMGPHWDYPNIGLNNDNRARLASSPFFSPGKCSGDCGGYSGESCWCDDLCSQYGDCCSDYVPICHNGAGPVPNGRYSLEVQAYSGGYADVQWGGIGNGQSVWLWSWNGSGAQLWDLTHNPSDDTYTIRGVQSGKCLASNYPWPSDGYSNVFIWDCDSTPTQRWRIEPAGGGYYYVRVQSQNYSSCLDTCCSIGTASNTYYYPCHWGVNQKWKLARR